MARFSQNAPAPGETTLLSLVRVLGALVGTACVLLALFYTGYLSLTDLEAPGPTRESTAAPRVDETGRRVAFERSFLAREGKLWSLHLEGTPTQIGDAHGHLTARLFDNLHQHLDELLARRYPTASEAWGASMLLRWHYREADAFLTEPDRAELHALASALPEARTGRYGAYHTLFLYQCFQELAQRLEDVVVQGTVFAVAPRTPAGEGSPGEGNLVVGRSFSMDLGLDYELHRIVSFYYPDGKYPFASVGWAGLMGVVTGINSRGVFVALNAARTDDPLADGAPLPLVLRQVLEEADSLDRAVEILVNADIRTSGIVLVADGVSRRAVVLELSARDKEEGRVVRGDDEAVVYATNHMIEGVFEDDPHNDKLRRDTSSGYRFTRLEELLPRHGPVSALDAVTILRDRSGHGGASLGLGNENALENLRTTHSVVVDASAMVMWVAEGPSTLGRYRAFDLRHLLGRQGKRAAPLEDLRPDPLLFSAEYRDYQEALAALAHARDALRAGRPERAKWSAMVGLALAPDVGDLHRIMGDVSRILGENENAREHYERYLELVPGRLRDQERVRGLLAELAAQ